MRRIQNSRPSRGARSPHDHRHDKTGDDKKQIDTSGTDMVDALGIEPPGLLATVPIHGSKQPRALPPRADTERNTRSPWKRMKTQLHPWPTPSCGSMDTVLLAHALPDKTSQTLKHQKPRGFLPRCRKRPTLTCGSIGLDKADTSAAPGTRPWPINPSTTHSPPVRLTSAASDPTYAGALSFMRRKYTKSLKGADAVVWGIPLRRGRLEPARRTRFGPQVQSAVQRRSSTMIRNIRSIGICSRRWR